MKARTLLVLFAVACLTIAAAVWLGPVYRDNQVTRESLSLLRQTLDRQALDIERLNQELRELRTDYRAIERVARERFGMCRPGEEIYHFEGAAEAEGATPPTPAPGAQNGAKGRAP
jgi:cell division protein FtsB